MSINGIYKENPVVYTTLKVSCSDAKTCTMVHIYNFEDELTKKPKDCLLIVKADWFIVTIASII